LNSRAKRKVNDAMSEKPRRKTQSLFNAFCTASAIGIGSWLALWCSDLGSEYKTPASTFITVFAVGFATSASGVHEVKLGVPGAWLTAMSASSIAELARDSRSDAAFAISHQFYLASTGSKMPSFCPPCPCVSVEVSLLSVDLAIGAAADALDDAFVGGVAEVGAAGFEEVFQGYAGGVGLRAG
jgi:hypothetical protein